MHLAVHSQPDAPDVLIDAIGGEPLAGSGFEREEPEQDFSASAPDEEQPHGDHDLPAD